MRTILIYLTFGLIPALFAQSASPVVSNVEFHEREDRSFIVDIYYDVYDSSNGRVKVSMEVSSDAGLTWNFPADSVYGDIGKGITTGAGKHIVWNFGAEHPQFYSDSIVIKIIADDTLICGESLIYAGKTYNTVLIGSQCWLKENLDVGTMIINNSVDDNQTDNGIIEKYCYENDPAFCTDYGGLYQWNEAMQYVSTEGAQGICPDGWHIPTKTEMEILSETVGEKIYSWLYTGGNALKAIGEGIGEGAGTDSSGFSALLTGTRYYGDGVFYSLGEFTDFWNTSQDGSGHANIIFLYNNKDYINFNYADKNNGYSIRCLRD